MKKLFLISFVLIAVLTACNKDWSFPDYKYTSVYFPYQSPVRTLVLGEDVFDNTLDNQRKFLVMATMGGVYENKNDVVLNLAIDPTLAAKLKFGGASGDSVYVLPSNYYTLPKDAKIVIPKGSLMGGLEVQLTDAFFQDPKAVKNAYVLPVKITSVTGADSILVGRTLNTSPDPRQPSDWIVAPKNFTLYGIKYINPYHGIYLRRGVTEVKGNAGNTALDTTIRYHAEFVERDQLATLYTKALDEDTVSLTTRNRGNTTNVPFRLLLKFDSQGKATVSAPSGATYSVTGNGQFVKKGDMWGEQKRDVLHLNYQVNFGTTTHSFMDTLVMRDRGVKMETFTPFIVK